VVSAQGREVPQGMRGVWIAYSSDWSGFLIFRDELRCLRHAVAKSMNVVFCPFEQDPRDVAKTIREDNP